MARRGVHDAIPSAEAERLLSAPDNDARLRELKRLEAARVEPWFVASDEAWDAMHRCLSNGTLFYDEGEYPLNRAVLGGKHLFDGDEYIITWVPPNEVKDVAAALAPLTEEGFRERYFALDPDDYDLEHGEEDFKYVWGWFKQVRALYARAAAEGRGMTFTVSP